MNSKRMRSPNYPAISLSEAIPRIRAIYDNMVTRAGDSSEIAQALGYSGTNGASDVVISALKKYDLLENVGDRKYKLSPKAIDIYLHQRGDAERKKAIIEAAFMPPLFAELHDEFGVAPPPGENALRIRLLKKEFNPKTVGDVIRAYLDTLELVAQEAPDYNKGVPAAQNAAPQNLEGAHKVMGTPAPIIAPPEQPPAYHGSAVQESADFFHSTFLSYPRKVRAEIRVFGDGIRKQDIVRLSDEIKNLAKAFDEDESVSIKRTAVWRNKDFNIPVIVTSEPEKGTDGKEYVSIEGSGSRVPFDEVEFSD